MFAAPFGFPEPPIVEYSTTLTNSTAGTVFTFASAALGSASGTRKETILCISPAFTNTGSVVSVTVGGVSARIIDTTTYFSIVAAVIAVVDTSSLGATADVVVTLSSSQASCKCRIFATDGTCSVAETGYSSNSTTTLTTYPNGASASFASAYGARDSGSAWFGCIDGSAGSHTPGALQVELLDSGGDIAIYNQSFGLGTPSILVTASDLVADRFQFAAIIRR